MVKINTKNVSEWVMFFLLIFFSVLINPVLAIDSPDAPDLIGEFEAREQVFLKEINHPRNGARDYLIAYDNYQNFLDDEMNKAYYLVKSRLSAEQQQKLIHSQCNWMKFRDAEFELIKNTWTRQDFGSSAGISRGSYRCTIIRNRVLQLLHYAKNYSGD
ncbi:MAG: lysozyme inhibitor LprI family protein [Gammaproteobacteria bacterium]|nr:lysozyme inhibitor LprI family protein [Gammaproteobacteria bacterium]